MIRYGLLAAGLAFALAGPSFAQDIRVVPSDPGLSGSSSPTVIIAPREPPAPRVEVPPPAPSTRMVWHEGHWRWQDGQYVWISGHYVERPTETAAWMPGHWERRAEGWVWIEGHWR